jgi:hypothetical protein
MPRTVFSPVSLTSLQVAILFLGLPLATTLLVDEPTVLPEVLPEVLADYSGYGDDYSGGGDDYSGYGDDYSGGGDDYSGYGDDYSGGGGLTAAATLIEATTSNTSEDRRRLFFGGPAPTPNCEIHTTCVDCGNTFGCSWCHNPLGCVFPKKTTGINGRGKSVTCNVFPKTCAGEGTLPPVPTPRGGFHKRKYAPRPTPFPTAYDAHFYQAPKVKGGHTLDISTGIPHRNPKLYRKCMSDDHRYTAVHAYQ